MGRPLLDIDPQRVFKLAQRGCTNEEIADILGCSPNTIGNRFCDVLANARAVAKKSLRLAQWTRAIRDRSDTMLIHLGKHVLGQIEKSGQTDGGITISIGQLAAVLSSLGYEPREGRNALIEIEPSGVCSNGQSGQVGNGAALEDAQQENNGSHQGYRAEEEPETFGDDAPPSWQE